MEEFQWSKEQVKWERKITIYKTDIKELSNIMHKDLKCERCTKIYNVKLIHKRIRQLNENDLEQF